MAKRRLHYFGASEEKARIEIIPMIDIMMFLLVFFMLATLKMLQSSGIELELPQSSTAQEVSKSITVTIGVTRDGKMYVDSDATPMGDAEVVTLLQQKLAEHKVDVIIAGDKGTVYENIVRVMDIVRNAGISSIALVTKN